MASPLLPENKPRQYQSRHSVHSSINLSPRSVSFVAESNTRSQDLIKPMKVLNKERFLISFTEGLCMFDKKNRCKVLFQVAGEKGKAKPDLRKYHARTNSIDESPMNITDSFQYRAHALIEEEDLILDVTPTKNKNFMKKTGEIDLILGLWLGKSKKHQTQVVKSTPKMRRKSDTSMWSGGVSELERKTFFWTFEYVAKPMSVQTDTKSLGKDAESSKAYKPSLRLDGSPMSGGKKGIQENKLKRWSRMALDMNQKDLKEDMIDDKDSSHQLWSTNKDVIHWGDNLAQGLKDKSDRRYIERTSKGDGNPKLLGGSKACIDSKNNLDSEDTRSKTSLSSPAIAGKLLERFQVRKSRKSNTTRPSISDQPVTQISEPKQEPIKIQDEFKPYKPKRSNYSTASKQNICVKPTRNLEKSGIHESLSIAHRREMSTDTLVKGIYSKNASLSNSLEGNQSRENSKEKKASQTKNPDQPERMSRTKVLLKLHESLINKIYKQDNGYSAIITTKSPVIKEEKKIQQKSSRYERRSPRATQSQLSHHIQLPQLNQIQSPKIHNSAKNSLERSHTKSFFQTSRRGKGSMTNLLATPEPPSDAKIKILKAEKRGKNQEKSGRFKPAVSSPKELMTRYGLLNF